MEKLAVKMCRSNLSVSVAVRDYRVEFLSGARDGSVDGWSCTCPDFKYRHRRCKHIEAVDDGRCCFGWEGLAGSPVHIAGDVCPNCGGDVVVVNVAI